MTTAHDVACSVLVNEILDASGTVYTGDIEVMADAVLAALGIPADTTTDDVKAAMILWRDSALIARRNPAGWKAEHVGDGPLGLNAGRAFGNTRAAAVLALAAKLDEAARDDAECPRCASDPADGLGCVACDARFLPDSDKEAAR